MINSTIEECLHICNEALMGNPQHLYQKLEDKESVLAEIEARVESYQRILATGGK